MKTKAIFLIVTMFLTGTIRAQGIGKKNEQILSQFNCVKNIIYKTVNGESLDMILFLPKERKSEKIPVMLYTHGGGWNSLDKFAIFKQSFLQTLKILTDNGVACAAIEYRLTRPNISNVFDCVVDCKDAARFLMKNATKYGLDIDNMGVWGGSAGGHLCLMTALGPDNDFTGDPELKGYDPHFKCVVSYYPLTTFMYSELFKGSIFENPQRSLTLFSRLFDKKEGLDRLVSPAEYLSKSSPPILIFHGDNDQALPISQSTYFVSIAKEKGADVKLVTVKGAGHSFIGKNISPSIPEINQMAADFILNHLHQ